MAVIPGTNLSAPIVPQTTEDTYPTHDALFGKGGFRTVASIAERDAIPAPRRTLGMIVCLEDGTPYTLKTGLTNADWEELTLMGTPLRIVPELPPVSERVPGVVYATATPQLAVPGPAGPPPTLLVGNVTTGNAGSEAVVAIRPGAAEGQYYLDVKLPRGDTGLQGPTGVGSGSPVQPLKMIPVDVSGGVLEAFATIELDNTHNAYWLEVPTDVPSLFVMWDFGSATIPDTQANAFRKFTLVVSVKGSSTVNIEAIEDFANGGYDANQALTSGISQVTVLDCTMLSLNMESAAPMETWGGIIKTETMQY